VHDLAFGIRLLRRSPAFTLLALLCLALGIGVNASMFSLLDSFYLRPLPVDNADRVVVLSRGGSPLFPYSEYRALRDRNQSIEGLAISEPEESDLSFEGNAILIGAEPIRPRLLRSDARSPACSPRRARCVPHCSAADVCRRRRGYVCRV